MNSNDIRKSFLKFFEDRGHRIVRSSSLIPAEDPTLLFANAGMNQFKDVFLGREQRDYTRAVTSQKCVRAGGKHNDLDVVGRTRRHQTFFEMLGNFSFGDYFKKEAIEYAWTLLTNGYGLPVDRLWVTVFREDDEAFDLWSKHVGVAPNRIVRMDEKDNFWQMGETGPCGPCSEIHYDLGPAASESGDANETFPSESGRYVEIWNLVFMQFDRDENGVLHRLPKPSIDTGMGLERLASVLQGKISNFETDLLRPIIDRTAEIVRAEYGRSETSDVSLRVIADHVRAATFLISDGVVPSNEGRGYVLRKIMRRAIRQGTLLGHNESFLYELSGFVTEMMKEAYPELIPSRDYVSRVIRNEEERFRATVTVGLERLEGALANLSGQPAPTLPGAEIFKLYDTFGLPLDFTKEIADEKGIALDLTGFEAELEKQRDRARQSWKGDDTVGHPAYARFTESNPTRFEGYETTALQARVMGIIRNGESVEAAEGSDPIELILDRTPFYSESGGQVGDSGTLTGPQGRVRISSTFSPVRGVTVHSGVPDYGRIAVGQEIHADVDRELRRRTAANHTATHLLHAALRDTLGVHVKQAGSLVAPDRLRFDYTHFAPLTAAELDEIERRVNDAIARNVTVGTDVMDLNQAVAAGALAFFGEKYQQQVRVVSVPGVSKELCGGTHTRATGDIGLFKIVSESSVASGVRRIEAVTGHGVQTRLEEAERLLRELAGVVKSPRTELVRAVTRLMEQQKLLEREIEGLKRKSAGSQLDRVVSEARAVNGVPVVAQRLEGVDPGLLREMAEQVSGKLGSGVVVLGVRSDGKAALVTVVSEDLRKRLHAGNIIKKVASLVGGSGGGRPDFAQAGGKDAHQLDEALGGVYNIVAEFLG